jgi:hypothetical protein
MATCKGAESALRCLLPSFPNRHAAQLRAQLQPTSLQRVSQKSRSKSGPGVESNPGAGKSEREGVKVSPDRERLVAQRLPVPRLKCLERFMVEVRRRSLPRHRTDRDSKPLRSLSGICLSSRHIQFGSQEHRGSVRPRSVRAAISRLPATINSANGVSSSSPCGVLRLPAVRHAPCRLPPLRRRHRRKSTLG